MSDEEQVVMKLKDVMATLDSHLKLEKVCSSHRECVSWKGCYVYVS